MQMVDAMLITLKKANIPSPKPPIPKTPTPTPHVEIHYVPLVQP
jgi:hypothetical protein